MRFYTRGILNPLRLPVSPPGLKSLTPYAKKKLAINARTLVLEAEAGIEPASAALQAAA